MGLAGAEEKGKVFCGGLGGSGGRVAAKMKIAARGEGLRGFVWIGSSKSRSRSRMLVL